MSSIDTNLLALTKANAKQQVDRAAALRRELAEVDATCLRLYDTLHDIIRDGDGAAADHRDAQSGIDWDWDALRAVRQIEAQNGPLSFESPEDFHRRTGMQGGDFS